MPVTNTFDEVSVKVQNALYEAIKSASERRSVQPIDVAIAGLRMFLVSCAELETEVLALNFVHNGKPVKLSLASTITPDSDSAEFVSNEINREHQINIMDDMLDVAESPDFELEWDWADILVVSGRVFMLGYENLENATELRFRCNKKNYTFNIRVEK